MCVKLNKNNNYTYSSSDNQRDSSVCFFVKVCPLSFGVSLKHKLCNLLFTLETFEYQCRSSQIAVHDVPKVSPGVTK